MMERMIERLRNRFMHTFRARLALLYVVVESVILVVSGILLYALLSRQVYQQLDETLYHEASTLVQQLEHHRVYDWSFLLHRFSHAFIGSVQLVSVRGAVAFTAGEDLMGRRDRHIIAIYRQVLRGRDVAFVSTNTLWGKKNMRVLALPVHRRGQMVAVLLLAQSTVQIQGFFALLYWVGGILGVLSIVISAWAGYAMALRALRPIKEINRTARAVAAGDLSRRLTSKANEKEISELVNSLNRMFQALENSFEAQKSFTADASHELRIPLTILKGEIEVAMRKKRSAEEYRQMLRHSLSAVERMERIVNDLLMLARADAGQLELAQEVVDFSLLMQEVYQQHLMLYSEKKIALEADIAEDVQVLGDGSALERVVYNLLNNAYKHSSAGQRVDVRLYAEGEHAVVEVQDEGPGIPQAQQAKLFQRFYRSDGARAREKGGAGLGLAICKRIVDAHGGDISVISKEGEGACFRVMLPLASANPEVNRRLHSVMNDLARK